MAARLAEGSILALPIRSLDSMRNTAEILLVIWRCEA